MIKGRCHCKKIQFSIEPPTDFVSHCHCESCRLSHGSAFVTWTSVPLERFSFAEDKTPSSLRWYQSSDSIEWGFCTDCGSPLFYRSIATGHPESPRQETMYVSVGCLIDDLDRQPAGHVSFEESVNWFSAGDSLPKFHGKTDTRLD